VWDLASRSSTIDLGAQGETYALTQSIVVAFFVGVLWWSIGAAAVKGDVGLVGRRLFLDAPKVVVGSTAMLAILTGVTAALAEVEAWVVAEIGSGDGPFAAVDIAALDELSEVSLVAALPAMIVALAMVLVSLGLALFLVVRLAAINVLVVFVPLAMLAQLTSYSSMARLVMEKLLALLLCKTVILVSLAVAGGLIGNVPDQGDISFASPPPAAPGEELVEIDEVAMEEARRSNGDGLHLLGTMLAGLGVLIVAAFSPSVVFHLIPSAYHDSSPYSGSDVSGVFGGGVGHAVGNARRTASRTAWLVTGRRSRS
jgi:hypothetical protein